MRNENHFLLALLCCLLIVSCDRMILSEDYVGNSDGTPVNNSQIIGKGPITLGEKLANPYSLKNMQKALDTLLHTKGLAPIHLDPTDAYVRFRPTDTLEYRLLMEENLELFDYPLNYDLLTDGDYYHDPSIPEDEITWQYTVISTTLVETDIEYEEIDYDIIDEDDLPVFYLITGEPVQVSGRILDVCYFPENDPNVKSGGGLPVSAEELEAMAFELAQLPEEYKLIPNTKASEYTPNGYIQMSIDSIDTGVKGVKVRAQRLLRWDSVYSSPTGHFVISKKFGPKVNLSVVYENEYDFVIWGNYAFLSPAKHTFPDCATTQPIYATLTKENQKRAWKWAIVNNSAYDYYDYCTSEGIPQPPANLKIWCLNFSSFTSAPMLHHLKGYKIGAVAVGVAFLCGHPLLAPLGAGVVGLLCIALPDLFIDITSDTYYEIATSTKHELSHASHYSTVGESFWGKYINYIVTHWGYGNGESTSEGRYICELGESWAYAHERYLYPGDKSGYSLWFAPSIDAIEALLEDGCISVEDYFSQLKCNTYSINDVYRGLITKNSSAKTKIDMAFAIAGVLDSQAQWKIENKADTCVTVSIKRNFMGIYHEELKPNESIIIAGVNNSTQTVNYSNFRFNPSNRPLEIMITLDRPSKKDTIYREALTEETICKMGREMSREDNWEESVISEHGRNVKIWTYSVKSVDLGRWSGPIGGGISGVVGLN